MVFFQKVVLFLHDLMQLLRRIESIYYLLYWSDLLLLFCFLSSQENLYMIHHRFYLFCGIYDTINEHKQSQKNYLSSIFLDYFDVIKEWFKRFFNNFVYFVINHDLFIITFWMHYTLFIIILRRNKINCCC